MVYKTKKKTKCIHGKEFCCECTYGKIQNRTEVHSYDFVDELRMPIVFKLKGVHFGED